MAKKRDEEDFAAWLQSIKFVGKTGKVLPAKLTKDNSLDPEGDRGNGAEGG